MTRYQYTIRIVWLFITMAIVVGLDGDKDARVVRMFLLLIWCAPFYAIWVFHIADSARIFNIPYPLDEYLGMLFSVVCTYVFWFIIFPKISQYARKRKNRIT